MWVPYFPALQKQRFIQIELNWTSCSVKVTEKESLMHTRIHCMLNLWSSSIITLYGLLSLIQGSLYCSSMALKVLCRESTTHKYLHTTASRMCLLEFIVCFVYQSKESCVNYQHRPASNTWDENSKTCLCVQGTDTCRLTQQEFCFDNKTNHSGLNTGQVPANKKVSVCMCVCVWVK